VSAYVAADGYLAAATKGLPQRLGMSSLYGATLSNGDRLAKSILVRHPYLNGIVLSRTNDLSQFKLLVPPIDGIKALLVAGSSACTWRRESGAIIYVVVTDQETPGTDDLMAMLEQALPCEAADSSQR